MVLGIVVVVGVDLLGAGCCFVFVEGGGAS